MTSTKHMKNKKRLGDWERKRRVAIEHFISHKIQKIDPSDHHHLLTIVPRHAADYPNFGEVGPDLQMDRRGDCSGNCKWYHPLQGKLGEDWGVCVNPRSHRCGLLTFEHQGCPHVQER